MIIMALLGSLFILIYLFFAFRNQDNLFLEILSVIGSFGLSESVGCFLLERPKIRNTLYETAQFLTADISFES